MGDESGRAVVRPVRQQAGLPNWWKVCFVHGDQTKYYRKNVLKSHLLKCAPRTSSMIASMLRLDQPQMQAAQQVLT